MAATRTWTDERIDLLRDHFEAGRTCREIAAALGVSRNAVIGKLSRLQLSHSNDDDQSAPSVQVAKPRRPRAPGRPPAFRALRAAPLPDADADPIHNGHCCSLMDLTPDHCRWPLGGPGAEIRYCGNPPAQGMPYCPGHARLAYRPGSAARRA